MKEFTSVLAPVTRAFAGTPVRPSYFWISCRMSPSKPTSSQTILKNSFWYGLETVIEIVVFTSSSIAVARYLGPSKLGYFSFINFFVSILTRTAGQGVSLATRKYMTEYLALGRPGTARAVYNLAWRYQFMISAAISLVSILVVVVHGDPTFRWMAVILLASIIPGLMSWVPAQANSSFEDIRPNTISAFGYLFSYAVLITLTVWLHWDLIGVASATFVARTVEVVIRTGPVSRRLRTMPLDTLEPELVARIRRFCLQGVWLQLLTTVVWDRSELLFLRHFSSLEQTAFYSVSFTFTSSMLTVARVFSNSVSLTLMGEASRSYEKVRGIVWNSSRFLMLLTMPISVGAAAVTYSGIHVAYGMRYLPAVPVMMTAVLLGIPRAFQILPETLLRAADRQNTILLWYAITGAVNGLLDWALIPQYAAMGAAWGNGLAQIFGVIVIWIAADRIFQIRFPWTTAVRIGISSLVMAIPAYFVSHHVPGVPGFVCGILAGCVAYPLALRLFRALAPTDRGYLELLTSRAPGALASALRAVVSFVTPATV